MKIVFSSDFVVVVVVGGGKVWTLTLVLLSITPHLEAATQV